ncbi:MAG TPA: signal peptidase II [Candidatus Binatia bacterium]|nr:signal peptidase II [Candidatus Binatia bacterium]
MRKYYFFIATIVLLLDRIAKWAVASNIPLQGSVVVMPGFFRLYHVQNTGAAFGLFAESSAQWKVGALVTFSVLALVIVSALLWKNGHSLSTTTIGLSLILGGAMGNLWDRMFTGYVIDFLDFYVGSYHWPAFNVADGAIVVGAVLLVSEIVFAKSANETLKSNS